jgi:hypothetical protein
MPHHLGENVVGATWVADEKPKLSVLVVDGEPMPSIGEVNPSLRKLVSDKVSDLRSSQRRNMNTKPVPRLAFRQSSELARAIVHRVTEKCRVHE